MKFAFAAAVNPHFMQSFIRVLENILFDCAAGMFCSAKNVLQRVE
jgi:hypothetical protein